MRKHFLRWKGRQSSAWQLLGLLRRSEQLQGIYWRRGGQEARGRTAREQLLRREIWLQSSRLQSDCGLLW